MIEKARLSSRTIGLIWMLASTVALTLNHASIRWISHDLHAFEITFFRNLLGVVMVLPMLAAGRFQALRTERPAAHFGRAVLNAGFMLTYFLGLTYVPLADATALGFTGPLFAAVLASLVLGEKLSIPKIIGLSCGFAGVLLIVQPGASVFSWAMLLIVASSVFFGFVMVTVRDLARTESSLTITAYVAIFLVPITFIPAIFVWQWPTPIQFAKLCLMALFATIGQYALSQASKHAETSVIMPVDFLRIVWASLIGIMLFGEMVTLPTLAGAILVFAGASAAAFWQARPSMARSGGAPAKSLAK